MRAHPGKDWASALPMVQVAKNRRYHRGIERTPYEAMFGRKLKMGNEDGNMPTREQRGIPPANNDVNEQFPSICVGENEVAFKKLIVFN